MNLDPKLRALEADVDAVRERLRQQLDRDADNAVALAMYRADRRRARIALEEYRKPRVKAAASPLPAVRQYIDGRLVA
jgi:hypothetical protein